MIRNLFKAVLRALFGLLYRVEVRGHVYGLVNYERTAISNTHKPAHAPKSA